jgi:hypothetical protein
MIQIQSGEAGRESKEFRQLQPSGAGQPGYHQVEVGATPRRAFPWPDRRRRRQRGLVTDGHDTLPATRVFGDDMSPLSLPPSRSRRTPVGFTSRRPFLSSVPRPADTHHMLSICSWWQCGDWHSCSSLAQVHKSHELGTLEQGDMQDMEAKDCRQIKGRSADLNLTWKSTFVRLPVKRDTILVVKVYPKA